MIDQFLATWCRISIQASVLLILVLLITQLFGRWLTPRVRFWLWGLVLLRFLIPVAPASGLSLYGLFTAARPVTVAQVHQTTDVPVARSANHVLPPMMPFAMPHDMPGDNHHRLGNQNRDARAVESESRVSTSGQSGTESQPPRPLRDRRGSDFPLTACAALIWLIGVTLFGLDLLRREIILLRRQRHWRLVRLNERQNANRRPLSFVPFVKNLVSFVVKIFYHKVHKGSTTFTKELQSMITGIHEELGLWRNVQVYLTPEPVGAASCGVFRPKILLSESFLETFTPGEIRLVLLHEMMHHKRLDPVTHLLSLTVRVLHWPNPLAWLLVARLRTERELAVDEAVVRHTGIKVAPDYGDVILKTVRQYATLLPAPGLLGVQSHQDQFLERRITMLLQHKKSNFMRVAFGLMLVTLLALVGLTDAKNAASGFGLQTSGMESQETATGNISTSAEETRDRLENDANVAIRGCVVDEDGKPVAGVLVRYFWFGYTQQDRMAKTDHDGYFTVEAESKHVNPWGWLYAVSEDFTMSCSRRVFLEEGSLEIPDTIITLKPGRVITGAVVDRDGKPVEGATVAGADQTTRSNWVQTNAAGEFRFSFDKNVESDLQQVYAFKENVGFGYLCTDDSKTDDGPFTLKLSPIKPVEIKVVNENQEAIPDARVSAWLIGQPGEKDSFNTADAPDFFHTYTNAEGIATLRCLPEWAIDRTRYSASSPRDGVLLADGTRAYYGRDDKRMEEFPEGQDMPTFVLPVEARVKGTVKLPDGTPVPWARITRASHASCGHGIRFTDANGVFELRENVNEKFDLAVDESKFGATPGVFAFDVGDGSEEKTLDFVLEKGIRIYGTVYDLDGKPASLEYQIFINENDPNPEPCDPDSEDCPDGGCPVGIVIRQTSNYGADVLDGKYEYLLPAVPRS